MAKQGKNLVRSLKRKVLRTIFGPELENGCRRKNKNSEIYKLYYEDDDVKFIKFGRLIWAGHVMRMEGSDPAKNVFGTKTEGNEERRRGRPKLR
jgi:hypothetical protein